MSGGALTDHRYDTHRLRDWAREIRHQCHDDEYIQYSAKFKECCEWISRMMDDLETCVYQLDKVFSGDSGEDVGLPAIQDFRKKWFTGKPISEGDLTMLNTLTNALQTLVTDLQND